MIGTTDTRTHIALVLQHLDLVHLAGTATVLVALLLHVAVWLLQTRILRVVVPLVLEVGHLRSGGVHEAHVVTTTGEHGRGRLLVGLSHLGVMMSDVTNQGVMITGMIVQDHHDETSTTHIPARRDHAKGHLCLETAMCRQPEAVVCGRLCVRTVMKSHARASTGRP